METSINEIFIQNGFRRVDTSGLQLIDAALRRLGYEPTPTERGTLSVELKAFGEVYAIAYLVSAREVFYTDSTIPRESRNLPYDLANFLAAKLSRKQGYWVPDLPATPKHLDQHLFVVDIEGETTYPGFGHLAIAVEADCDIVRKSICTFEDLGLALSGPFQAVARRAHAEPTLYAARTRQGRSGGPSGHAFDSSITSTFAVEDFPEMLAALEGRANKTAIRDVTAELFRRVMGPDYALVHGEGWPEVARGESDWFVPFSALSSGERVILAFCLYLALAHDGVIKGMCLGIEGTLFAVDSRRRRNLLDCLRQFVLATGASLHVRADNSDDHALVVHRLAPAMSIAAKAPAA